MTLTPAYGRDYKSKTAVLADLNGQKDFQVQPQGVYATGDELAEETSEVTVRYGKQRKVMAAVHRKGVWHAL